MSISVIMCAQESAMAKGMLLLLVLMAGLLQTFAQSPVPLMHATQFVYDQDGNAVTDNSPGSTPVFDAARHAINDPAAKQLTVAEFNAAQGAISVKCTDSGTRTIFRLWRLVPHGTYKVGVLLMGGMGGPPIGMGALSDDPKASVFTADLDGEADFVVTKKAGPLSGNGDVTNCLLADLLDKVMQQPAVQVVGYYHFDNTTDASEPMFVPQFMFTLSRMMRLNNEIVNHLRKPIVDSSPASTLLYEFRKGRPVLAPAIGKSKLLRHHVTVGEFRKVSGSIAAKCTSDGTQVAMSLTGLIPHGVYTVWVAKPDPSDQTHMKMSGVGALGKDDGSQNSFTADEDGEAYISAVNPGGKLSTLGTIADCWLTGEPMVQIAGVYHIDGTTHGPVVGPDGTYVGQFAFAFMMTPPQPPPPGAKPAD
jgi:hypothetical protein